MWKVNLDEIRAAYFIGIGGIGMSALARYLKYRGIKVHGYDKTPSKLTDQLISEDIEISFQDVEGNYPKNVDLVVYTPAIPLSHWGLNFYKQKDYPLLKRSELLAELTRECFTIAVAGTHGKTTTTAIISHLLHQTNINSTGFVGGIMKGYDSNLILPSHNHHLETLIRKPIVVVEADEYDRSFLRLNPDIAIITSIDADHLDIYGDSDHMQKAFKEFAAKIEDEGKLIAHHQVSQSLEEPGKSITTYGFVDNADVTVTSFLPSPQMSTFNVQIGKRSIERLELPFPGKYNVENAASAVLVGVELGLSNEQIRNGIKTFQGIRRRFEIVLNTNKVVFIDDYAHHPKELSAVINSVRELYSGRRITGIFQPHLYSRTRDFVDDFARSLGLLDELILLDIYPAREEPIPGITSKWLLEKVNMSNKKLMNKSELVDKIAAQEPEVLLTLGAGDIDRLVEPIKDELSRK